MINPTRIILINALPNNITFADDSVSFLKRQFAAKIPRQLSKNAALDKLTIDEKSKNIIERMIKKVVKALPHVPFFVRVMVYIWGNTLKLPKACDMRNILKNVALIPEINASPAAKYKQ